MMPVDPNVKHPAILEAIERTHARQKRRMERTPGRVKPINEIPVGGLLIDQYEKSEVVYKPVETPVPGPVRLKLKRMDAVPYRPDWRDVTIALLIVYAGFLTAVVWL